MIANTFARARLPPFPPPLWGRVREGGSPGRSPSSWHPLPQPFPTRGKGAGLSVPALRLQSIDR
ncbi:hypothetical protein BF49_4172 [Bradyrhizobium sp.]|nr:hypothetical protein BF49_4172 [Bradyrhizobium sp.]